MAVELFIPKKFTGAHKQVIKQANSIIDEYHALGYRLTLRQIHYQFVARDWYDNTFANYKRLGVILDHARKAGLVDWDGIEDSTRILRRIGVWTSPESAIARLQRQFKLDPWEEQPTKRRIEVWVEKDAALSIIRPTCDDLRVSYFSCRGYSSSSGLYEAGKRLAAYRDAGYETLVLYAGDHDPSGIQMGEVTAERLELYGHGSIPFRRIALTLDQVNEYKPPDNFAKETDSRYHQYVERFGREECWELDALRPNTVDELIRAEIEPLIDRKAWDKTMEDEQEHLATLGEIISDWDRTRAAPDMLNLIIEHAQLTVEAEPIREEDMPEHYEHTDSATLAMTIDESQSLLDRHGFAY